MNETEKVSSDLSFQPLLEKEHGHYACATILAAPEEIYHFCQYESHINQVLDDLPGDVENFLKLKLTSNKQINLDQYKILWENRPEAKLAGSVSFLIKKAPAQRGSFLTVEANFEKLNFKEDSPSTLMNLFIKRFKALIETGEIPTIKGQPSGREELRTLH
jgi:hypothetical protein